MGIKAIYPRQNASRLECCHKVYPYLLRDLVIDHPNQAWSIGITHIPIRTDWLYLAAIMDWYSRYVMYYTYRTFAAISKAVSDACTAFSYHFAQQNPILTKTSKMRHIQSRQDLPE